MPELTSGQRKELRSLAHHLDPAVIIGKGGLTDNVVDAAHDALEAHELIKVKFNGFKEEKQELSRTLAERTQSNLVGIIGNIAIVYRRQEDDEKRRIELKS